MTDYIKQVAEADQSLVEALEALMEWQVKNVHVWNNDAYDQAFTALASWKAVHANVPKPEPVAYMTYKGYFLHASNPKVLEYSDPEPLYTYPPDAQAEIDRLNAKATEREAFIDQLLEDLRLVREQLASLNANGEINTNNLQLASKEIKLNEFYKKMVSSISAGSNQSCHICGGVAGPVCPDCKTRMEAARHD